MKEKNRADGWILLDRGIREHWIYSEKPFSRFQAWVDLIMSANFRDKDIMVNGKPFTVRRGSFLTSTRKLAERWGWSRNKVLRFLAVLRTEEMIKTEPHGGTLLTVVKYDFFQLRRDTRGATDGATHGAKRGATQGTQEKERRKKEKERERKESDSDDDGMTPDELERMWKERNGNGTV